MLELGDLFVCFLDVVMHGANIELFDIMIMHRSYKNNSIMIILGQDLFV